MQKMQRQKLTLEETRNSKVKKRLPLSNFIIHSRLVLNWFNLSINSPEFNDPLLKSTDQKATISLDLDDFYKRVYIKNSVCTSILNQRYALTCNIHMA
jgi:hypothetical protein